MDTKNKNRVKNRSKKGTIIICSAHNDDFVLGAGGAIARYASEGKRVIVLIFSYGEKSHPWLKRSVITKIRQQEAQDAGKTLRCKIHFFDLPEFGFFKKYKGTVDLELQKIFLKEKPCKIFTHSSEDPHPDHQAVNKITLEQYELIPAAHRPEIYSYSIWNPVSFKTQFPAFYIDVSQTLSLKFKALQQFRSQRIHILYPLILVFFRSIKDGFKIRARFGEHFFRIR